MSEEICVAHHRYVFHDAICRVNKHVDEERKAAPPQDTEEEAHHSAGVSFQRATFWFNLYRYNFYECTYYSKAVLETCFNLFFESIATFGLIRFVNG